MKKSVQQRYRRALTVCTDRLSKNEGDDAIQSALCFYRMGVALSRMGEVAEAIRCFNDAFMIRDQQDYEIHSLHYRQFHDIQMALYVLGKRNKTISSLAEGDMVHDLIKHRWLLLLEQIKNSQISLATQDLEGWFRSIKIDFPYEVEDFASQKEN